MAKDSIIWWHWLIAISLTVICEKFHFATTQEIGLTKPCFCSCSILLLTEKSRIRKRAKDIMPITSKVNAVVLKREISIVKL